MNIEKTTDHLYIAILCGGGGKRLWPRSRVQAPKQFIKLFGEKTIFQETVARSKRFVSVDKIFIITNKDYIDEIKDQAPDIPIENIIAEPLARNTALAMGLGAIYIQHRDPDAVVVNFASDHHIADLEEFDRVVKDAFEMAYSGDYLVTIGVKPTFPHTGMGYIKAGNLFEKLNKTSIYKVDKFIEKPDTTIAEKFLKEGGYYWNANLYTWRADSIMRAMGLYLSEMAAQLMTISKSLGTREEKETINKIYEKAEEISIDFGVSEKAQNMVLVPSNFSWSDIGDWKVVYDLSKKDENNNAIIFEKGKGDYLGIDTENCLIHFSDQLIATIGVDNLIIIDTGNALLVASKDRAEEVKKLVGLLKEKGKVEYL
jgi:mannose-1-phosphate guanylyltransferase